jgi:lipopolysaccharide export system protein LptA
MATMVLAEEKTGTSQDFSPDKPLQITADKMVAHQEASMVEFIGNVRANQDNALLLADSIKIFLHPFQPDTQDATGTGRIKQLVALDHVEYTAGDRQAFADKAVYTASDDILVLTGKNVKLLTGTSWVSGTKITLFRAQDRVMVESDDQNRVQALFNPEDKPADQ